MGTSRGYQMPVGGNWTSIKHDATALVQGSGNAEITPANVIGDFIRVNGGFRGMQKGHGGGAPSGQPRAKSGGLSGNISGGASRGSTSAAIGAARNLGAFLSRVGEAGFETALREQGLDALVGKSAVEISDALLDEFAGPASTLDNALAREALAEVRDELLEGAKTFEDVEAQLTTALDEIGLFGILATFFGEYIFKLFCRDFYEDWVKKVGSSKTRRQLNEMKDYITAALRAKLAGKKLSQSDWKGAAGSRLAESVLKDTLEVFGVSS